MEWVNSWTRAMIGVGPVAVEMALPIRGPYHSRPWAAILWRTPWPQSHDADAYPVSLPISPSVSQMASRLLPSRGLCLRSPMKYFFYAVHVDERIVGLGVHLFILRVGHFWLRRMQTGGHCVNFRRTGSAVTSHNVCPLFHQPAHGVEKR